ncbi:MAG: hypothetical protein VZR54_05365 [Ruminococcus sp.]|jgi:hypothetical protein|nr:hypothetical protein [Ruminococcus sp.]
MNTLLSLLFFLLFRVSSWLCSVPMWATLIAHFVFGLPIYWFWLTLAVWLLVGVFRFCLISFARWGGSSPDINADKPNKNPYSKRN